MPKTWTLPSGRKITVSVESGSVPTTDPTPGSTESEDKETDDE